MNFNYKDKSPSLSLSSCSPLDITPKRKLTSINQLTSMCPITEENVIAKDKKDTPLQINPFDVKAESLYFHSCSPFFATLSRNKKDDGSFRWSIEQLSLLYPADIDESSLPDIRVDADQEVQAQEAIDAFFSQNSIVPSPWSESPSLSKNKDIKLRRASHMSWYQPKVNTCVAATQTALSIPPHVDLSEILGKYFTFNGEENVPNSENSREELDPLSTSSLRRKLFVTDEECTSPTRLENKNLFSARLWSTPTAKSQSAHSSPASDVLSSSPITPPNCSDSCNIISSPPVSPIATDRNSISIQMKSFDDHSNSNIYYSPQNFTVAEESEMSFLTESQEANPFPSDTSEKQDTGYVTGSISSSQNMNFSEMNCGLISRITPVVELMEECELSSSISCDISFKNVCPSAGNSLSFKSQPDMPLCNTKTYPWIPTCSSTPSVQELHNA